MEKFPDLRLKGKAMSREWNRFAVRKGEEEGKIMSASLCKNLDTPLLVRHTLFSYMIHVISDEQKLTKKLQTFSSTTF